MLFENKEILKIDKTLIKDFQVVALPLARIALFIVYFWFGILKVLGLSPASELVRSLYDRTITFVPFHEFYILFALFECLIGILFLIKGAERIVLPLLAVHMLTAFLPLVMLPSVTWQSFLVPTLEGQYIIKNVLLVATAIFIMAHVRPLKK